MMLYQAALLWLLSPVALADDSGPASLRDALLMAQSRRESPICYIPVSGDAGERLLQLYDREEDPPVLLVAGLGPTLETALSRVEQYAHLDPDSVPPCKPDTED